MKRRDGRKRDRRPGREAMNAEAMDAVDTSRKDHGLEHEGNPRGLKEEALNRTRLLERSP